MLALTRSFTHTYHTSILHAFSCANTMLVHSVAPSFTQPMAHSGASNDARVCAAYAIFTRILSCPTRVSLFFSHLPAHTRMFFSLTHAPVEQASNFAFSPLSFLTLLVFFLPPSALRLLNQWRCSTNLGTT